MNNLKALREKIDQLDSALHDLLIQRVEIGRDVAAAKAKSGAEAGGANLRPGREAQIMRRLYQRNRAPLPPAAVANVWREILSANLNQQVAVTAGLFAPTPEIRDLARDYCASASAIRPFDSPEAALTALMGGETTFAILPTPASGGGARWWPILLNDQPDPKPQIIVRLPFFDDGATAANAVIVARREPEASGDDKTLFAVEAPEASEASSTFAGLAAATVLAGTVLIDHAPESGWLLVEVDGFQDALKITTPHYRIGAYATPIHVNAR